MWDWNGVIGTGQSLSVGAPPATSHTQPHRHLMLSLGPAGNSAVPPWDPTLAVLSMVPLVEPIRSLATGFPSPYPANVYGETLHASMAREVSSLLRAAGSGADHATVHTVVGESGQGIVELRKHGGDTTGITGRAYAATLFEVTAIARLAKAAGRSYGIGLVVMTHGETDNGRASYGDDLLELFDDYQRDLAAITGQVATIPMYVSQQHAFPNGRASEGQRPIVNSIQWQLGVRHPGRFVCTGPKYQYACNENGDGVHLSATGTQALGEKIGQVYVERAILGRDWQPLAPIGVERSGRVVAVRFRVPVPPLRWDSSFDAPALAVWARGRGFELEASAGPIAIESVAIAGDTVRITAAEELPPEGLLVGYALASQGVQMGTASRAVRWGQLRDSDPFVGTTTHLPNPNYAVSFVLPVP